MNTQQKQFEAYRLMLKDLEEVCENNPPKQRDDIIYSIGQLFMRLTMQYTDRGAYLESILSNKPHTPPPCN